MTNLNDAAKEQPSSGVEAQRLKEQKQRVVEVIGLIRDQLNRLDTAEKTLHQLLEKNLDLLKAQGYTSDQIEALRVTAQRMRDYVRETPPVVVQLGAKASNERIPEAVYKLQAILEELQKTR